MSAEAIRYLILFISLGLLMLMQIGFLCLESGIVRSKNSINVAAKNLLDLMLVILLFWVLGYSMMFGSSYFGLIGRLSPLYIPPDDMFKPLFFLFQAMFAATAVTIVSGPVAERCSLKGYLVIVLIVTLFIYPVVGHWVWGGLYLGEQVGWLEKEGFYDFAGSSVVHVTGGGVALAAVMVLGPRMGYLEKLSAGFAGHSMVTTILGYLFLWLGWFGFNGGSVVLGDLSRLPTVLMNTAIAGSAGGFGVLALELVKGEKLNILSLANGIISGLVSVTAGCDIFSAGSAVVVGLCGGLLAYFASTFLVKFKIDDPVEGIPVHLIAGIWGTLAVALFAVTDAIPDSLSRLQWFFVQLRGTLIIAVWAVGTAWIFLKLYNYIVPLRVSSDGEEAGLNFTEHGARTEMYDLLQDMKSQQDSGDFSREVRVEPYSEIGQVGFQYNQVTQSFNTAQKSLYDTIGDLEKTRKALDEACKKAEMASDYKSAFLANMSHEIRTPINGVIGMAELLQLEEMPPKQLNYIKTIHSSARGLVKIINDILDYSKIEAGELALEFIEFDLYEVLRECLDIFTIQAGEKNLELSVELHPDSPRLIYGDPTRIRQIIINLMGNALKFTDSGSICLYGDVVRVTEGDRLVLSVQDTGIGMTRDQCERVFTAFQQADHSTTRQYGGTGLGLSITRQLVEMMSGEIKAYSQPGKGSRFEISIPTRIAEDVQSEAVSSVKDPVAEETTGADQWINSICHDVLVAEDNQVNQMVIRKYLEKLGITGKILENGKQAVSFCESHTPQLILMDCEMPEMDGLTATRMIREQKHHKIQPIIIGLSAHAMKDHEQQGLSAGMDAYLTKPVTLDQLKSSLLQFFKGLPEE
ncbi:ammonium transporter [Endozoicomonas sp.]|uniref:ammonium transporter n=1 Tax=Endozoicomonas sp. TaxID=1892382 RepID=UPI0028884C46|nr:ammonium transporter [Endozoicomonas sp.]